jgi:tRNA threonylcarbamoyladenosine biosynthesis protein TsaB
VNLLAIETSTEFLSLAAGRGDAVHVHHVHAGQRHAELILDSISALLAQAGLRVGDLEGVAYGEGPGSFTGLRIACGVVQGLALARGLKVLGVSTLLALAEEGAADKVLACIDARMGEVYHAAYCRDGGGDRGRGASAWRVVHAPALCRPNEVPVPEGGAWSGFGSGFAAHKEVLRERLAGALDRVEPAVFPTAAAVLRLARPRFGRGEGEAPEGAVPVYIRDKVALKTSER